MQTEKDGCLSNNVHVFTSREHIDQAQRPQISGLAPSVLPDSYFISPRPLSSTLPQLLLAAYTFKLDFSFSEFLRDFSRDSDL
ncbi:hypothetical protein M0804_005341 [Polistes exclamans]|nr:hypothetical protein M0804_005341 [Polistes exclamans]